jgi:hypothetical protein
MSSHESLQHEHWSLPQPFILNGRMEAVLRAPISEEETLLERVLSYIYDSKRIQLAVAHTCTSFHSDLWLWIAEIHGAFIDSRPHHVSSSSY